MTSTRDFVGYGPRTPDPQWPRDALLAVQFVMAVEGGAERCVLHGDTESESVLTDLAGVESIPDGRNMHVEGVFEYGSRSGVWRLLRLFEEYGVPISAACMAPALEAAPEIGRALVAGGHEIVCHGWRWIDYGDVPEDVEREHIARAAQSIRRSTGVSPAGYLAGRPGPNTRRLVAENGGFLYDQDCLNDELPYWTRHGGADHLVLPYSFETNDNAFSGRQGFATGDEFFHYLRDAFDFLRREGEKGAPKMMTVAVHDRLTGRPARAAGFERFLRHIRDDDRIWIARGIDIAEHWRARHPRP